MFLTRLLLEDDPQPGFWVHRAPLVWDDPIFGHIVIPAGFRTDLASYPAALRGFPCFNVNGYSRRAACIHDWLYASDRQHRWNSKRRADTFLRAALMAEGQSWGCSAATYLGVHWFGYWSWDGDAGALERDDFDTHDNYLAWVKLSGGA